MTPIGVFAAESKYPYEARRQAAVDSSLGEIRLNPGFDFEQALEDLEGFERIWIVYQFHQNTEWKPKVMPPRGPRIKRGVFATRAPYRPNGIGLSCVRLVRVEGLRVIVEGHDLLDGTPVLDLKPYLPYADAFPEARVGWLEDVDAEKWTVDLSTGAEAQLLWLEERGISQLRGFVVGQLEFDPLDHKRKRVEKSANGFVLAYRTWRAKFTADHATRRILIESVFSGYTSADLEAEDDRYGDKSLHREFPKV